MEDLLKASESSSNDIQLEIENKTEFDNENHIVNDNNVEHDDMAKNGNQDSDIVSGIDSNVDANEWQNELEMNNVQDELMEGKEEKEAEAEVDKRGEEREVKVFNAEGEQNENDENNSKDDDEEDDDESDDDDDENQSDNDNENTNDTDSDGKKTDEPFKIEEDVVCRRNITALKVREVIIFHFYSFSAILRSFCEIVLRGSFRDELPVYRSFVIYVC